MAKIKTAEPAATSDADPAALDLGQLALFVGQAMNAATRAALAAKGFDVRDSHAAVIQHLVEGPLPIGDIAERLAVTQQAASKAVTELEALGYVERLASADDKRVTQAGLSARGREVLGATRKARAVIDKKLATALGVEALASARQALGAVLDTLGGTAAVRQRRVSPPR